MSVLVGQYVHCHDVWIKEVVHGIVRVLKYILTKNIF